MRAPIGILRGRKPKPAPGSHTLIAPLPLNRLENWEIGGTWCVRSSIPNRPVEEQTGIVKPEIIKLEMSKPATLKPANRSQQELLLSADLVS
jgi:hypothetical protein